MTICDEPTQDQALGARSEETQPGRVPDPWLPEVGPSHPDAALVDLWRRRNDLVWPLRLEEIDFETDQESDAYLDGLSEIDEQITARAAASIIGLAIKSRLVWQLANSERYPTPWAPIEAAGDPDASDEYALFSVVSDAVRLAMAHSEVGTPDGDLLSRVAGFHHIYRESRAADAAWHEARERAEAHLDCPPLPLLDQQARDRSNTFMREQGVSALAERAFAFDTGVGANAKAVFALQAATLRGALEKLKIVRLTVGDGAGDGCGDDGLDGYQDDPPVWFQSVIDDLERLAIVMTGAHDPAVEIGRHILSLMQEKTRLDEQNLAAIESGDMALDSPTPAFDQVQKDIFAVEDKMVAVQATTLPGALAQLLLVASYHEALTGAGNPEDLKYSSGIVRMLWSIRSVLEKASGTSGDHFGAKSYMLDRLNPFNGNVARVAGTEKEPIPADHPDKGLLSLTAIFPSTLEKAREAKNAWQAAKARCEALPDCPPIDDYDQHTAFLDSHGIGELRTQCGAAHDAMGAVAKAVFATPATTPKGAIEKLRILRIGTGDHHDDGDIEVSCYQTANAMWFPSVVADLERMEGAQHHTSAAEGGGAS